MLINDKEHYNKIKNTINMQNMRKLMSSKDCNVIKLAMNSGVSSSTINAYLNHQKLPSITTLVSIANYLNTSTDFLIGRTNNPSPIENEKDCQNNAELNILFQDIKSLNKDKQKLISEFVTILKK